ncbi:MAG: hypothetical protein K1X95_00755 [Acidimicrobiia bacterium]|nr:hypothetical protein [Acidimicrobiia bacterium]
MSTERRWPRGRNRVAAGALVSVCLLAGCAGTASPSQQPQQPQQQQEPQQVGGMPGAVQRAGEVRDQTNQHTEDLEDQIETYGK